MNRILSAPVLLIATVFPIAIAVAQSATTSPAARARVAALPTASARIANTPNVAFPSPLNDGAQWRRTTRGWEKKSKWQTTPPPPPPPLAALHPGLVAALMLLTSLAALLGLSPEANPAQPLALIATRR